MSRGLYVQAAPRTLAQTLHAWQQALPATAAFSHLTAAELRGWWLPSPIPHPIFVAALHQLSRPRRPGLLVCRHPKPFGINLLDGLRVTSATETLLAAARDLGVLDLVVLGDSALRLGHCTITDLKITAGQRRRGAPLLRQVIELLDPRSESPWESVMRVLHVAAEIPVDPQFEIFDDRGRFVARADLRVRGTRRIHEYDGEMHRTPDVQDADLVRDRRLMAHHWERHGFTSRHLLRDGATIIADADRLLGRPWDARRLYAWRQLIEHSLYCRTGRARAYRHWQRASPENGSATAPYAGPNMQ